MDQILEKLILANKKGTLRIWNLKKKFTYLTQIFLFCVLSVYAEQSYLPQKWSNKNFFQQNLNIIYNNTEKVQISKLKPEKFPRLCTFEGTVSRDCYYSVSS